MEQTVFLVGARAAGKTTVGEALALALDCPFVDTDRALLQTTARTVAAIVAEEGWDGFRKRESAVLQAVTRPGLVVATGGGMVLAEVNRAFMRAQGTVFYLYAPASVLSARLLAASASQSMNEQRPSLTGRSTIAEVSTVLALRDPLYQQVAHCVLDATAPLQDIVAHVTRALLC